MLSDVTLLAPVPAPRVLFGVGLNYAAHAHEQGKTVPRQPIIFTMRPGAAAAPGADVRCPAVVDRLDYEGELAVIIGAQGAIAPATAWLMTSAPVICSAANLNGPVPKGSTVLFHSVRG